MLSILYITSKLFYVLPNIKKNIFSPSLLPLETIKLLLDIFFYNISIFETFEAY